MERCKKWEITLSYGKSRSRNCSQLISRKISGEIISHGDLKFSSNINRMIQRFHDQFLQRMSPERRARKLSMIKALTKTRRNKNKENEDPLNNNMALPYSFTHSTPLKNQQITDLDQIDSETEAEVDTHLVEAELCALEEELGESRTRWGVPQESKLVIAKMYDLTEKNSCGDSENTSEYPDNEVIEAGITVMALEELDSQNDKHWRSLEVLHENAEYEFCRSLEASKLFVSTSSLLEEIEADLPSPYSLAKPLNHTFHTLTSYRTQTRLARMDANLTCPELLKKKESADAGTQSKKVEYLQMEARVQKALAEQSEKALNLSKAQKFFGVEHIESEKALLLANLRFNAAMQEARKLKILGEVPEKENFGQITLSEIIFQVNDSKSDCPDIYICTATERENVQATSIVKEVTDGKLLFNECFKFQNLHKNFVIYVELFKLPNKEPKKMMLTTALVRKLRKMTAVNHNRSLTVSSYNPCGFVSIAQCELRLKQIIGRKNAKCTLQNFMAGAASPEVNLLVKTALNIQSEQRGFLNVFKQTWHRRWYSLTGFFLESWLYPEDQESDKAPVDSIYLPNCSSVEAVGLEICIRPHSFVITLKENAGEFLFSASSHNDMLTWVDQLNLILGHIQLWDPNV